jgi:hypothetical protein
MQGYVFDATHADEYAHCFHNVYIQLPDIFYPSPPSTDVNPVIASPEFIASKVIELIQNYAAWTCVAALLSYSPQRAASVTRRRERYPSEPLHAEPAHCPITRIGKEWHT